MTKNVDKKHALTLKQTLFCKHYLDSMGNGVEAVIKAGYKIKGNKRLAASIASENLTKPNISKYINLRLEQSGLNDISVQMHHLSLIKQNTNLHAKNRAIDMYYKMKGKYSLTRLEHNVDERLKQFLDRVSKRFP